MSAWGCGSPWSVAWDMVALLEGGLGFLQYFWDRNRQCAQDRLAETIVVDVRKRAVRLSVPNEDAEE